MTRLLSVLPRRICADDERHLVQYYRAREQLRRGWRRALSTRCKQQFEKEKIAVIDAIQTCHKGAELDAAQHAVEKQEKSWNSMLTNAYIGIAQDIAPMMLRQFKGAAPSITLTADDDIWLSTVNRYISQIMPQTVAGLSSTTQDAIRAQLEEGLHNGLSIPDMVRSMGDLYDNTFKPVRTMTIVRTELTTATGSATQAVGEYGAEKYGLTITKRWLTARDKNVRDSHQDMEGITVDLNDMFDVHGSDMMFPGDRANGAEPEEWVNCRCDVVQHADI